MHTSTNIEVFQNPEFGSVRTTMVDEEPYFVGKDVAQILGYENPTKAIRDHVEEDDRLVGVQNVTPSIKDALGREQSPTWINESGLYSLILSSKLPTARKFKRWVTSEVLPSIRRHGMFVADDILNNPDLIITALQEIKAEREKNAKLAADNAEKQKMITDMQPKAAYYDLILQNTSVIPITTIAKDYGFSGKTFNLKLHDLGIQYKLDRTWVLYQQYADKGYTQSKTHVIDAGRSVVNTYWTQKGRILLYHILKKNGILPVIEREAA